MANLQDLKPDKRNARKHTPRNQGMIEHSIQTNGFGRSVLLASDGSIIAGNATIDAATSAGLDDVLIVESDGTRVIAVKRTDVAPGSDRFHALAIADNRAAELAEWDSAVLEELSGEIDLSAFFFDEELQAVLERAADEILDTSPQLGALEYRIIVECSSEHDQADLLSRFESEGLRCQALMS